ncbi:MAG: hypothetical protein IJW99_09055 [Clostridia bacterium]|nr:hypothetical protein [Clostridia bacterium]
MNYDQLTNLLRNPPAEARGKTRWWWYGCAVTREDILFELNMMRDAGIGGVELQILYPVDPDDTPRGIRNIPYGSPAFYDILEFTAGACAERGMTFDFTPGSSWPFGGPTVEEEDAQQQVIPYQLDVHGPQTLSIDFTTRFAGQVVAASLGRMEKSVMVEESVRDVTGYFRVKELFGWPWGTELCDLPIPEGDYKLTFFVLSQHRNRVGKPSRGAEGYVLDHCSRRATERFLDRMVAPVTDRVPSIHSLFCDSIEVEGHNWTEGLLDEFQARRGYDLRPYLYALWGEIGDVTADVRYDYSRTMAELTVENFFDPFTAFAHARGMTSRIQAHGTWGDILRVYAAADIPEGETFGDHRTLRVNTIHRRLASSAAHVYGKPLISCETFTWLKRPRFTETPEEMKAAVDAVFCDGINMIVNHGYAHTAAALGKRRGNPFYASTHINHTLPWWLHYRHLGGYIHRTSAYLRQGKPTARVAVYLPQADIWSENMLSELHLAMRLDEYLDADAMDGIQKAGYTFDYINDEALTHLGTTVGGALCVGGQAYQAILLIGCTRLPTETASRLLDFVLAGGILIADHIPDRGCGLQDREKKAAQVRAYMDRARPILVSDRRESLLAALRAHLPPDVILSHPGEVGYVHRRGADGTHYWFLTNLSEQTVDLRATFRDMSDHACVHSLNSDIGMPIYYRRKGDTVSLCLAPHESVALTFFASPIAASCYIRLPDPTERMRLENFVLIAENREYPMVGDPISWETMPPLRHFSGTCAYVCRFEVPEEAVESLAARLTLSHMSAAAHIILNGKQVGDIWTHPLSISLAGYLREGTNELVVNVSSTLINEMMASPNGGEPELCPERLPEWPYYGTVINVHRKARLHNRREVEEQKEPLPSGIWGETYLEW